MKRFIQCVCLVVICFAVCTVTASVENINQRAGNYFVTYSAYFERVSESQYEICFTVTALDELDELGAKIMKLKRSADEVTGPLWQPTVCPIILKWLINLELSTIQGMLTAPVLLGTTIWRRLNCMRRMEIPLPRIQFGQQHLISLNFMQAQKS